MKHVQFRHYQDFDVAKAGLHDFTAGYQATPDSHYQLGR